MGAPKEHRLDHPARFTSELPGIRGRIPYQAFRTKRTAPVVTGDGEIGHPQPTQVGMESFETTRGSPMGHDERRWWGTVPSSGGESVGKAPVDGFFFFLIHMFVFRQSDYLLHRSEGLVPYASA